MSVDEEAACLVVRLERNCAWLAARCTELHAQLAESRAAHEGAESRARALAHLLRTVARARSESSAAPAPDQPTGTLPSPPSAPGPSLSPALSPASQPPPQPAASSSFSPPQPAASSPSSQPSQSSPSCQPVAPSQPAEPLSAVTPPPSPSSSLSSTSSLQASASVSSPLTSAPPLPSSLGASSPRAPAAANDPGLAQSSSSSSGPSQSQAAPRPSPERLPPQSQSQSQPQCQSQPQPQFQAQFQPQSQSQAQSQARIAQPSRSGKPSRREKRPEPGNKRKHCALAGSNEAGPTVVPAALRQLLEAVLRERRGASDLSTLMVQLLLVFHPDKLGVLSRDPRGLLVAVRAELRERLQPWLTVNAVRLFIGAVDRVSHLPPDLCRDLATRLLAARHGATSSS